MDNGKLAAMPCANEFAYQAGLTKRELFAAIAMSALAGRYGPNDRAGTESARIAVRYADALLAALEGGE